MKKLILSLLISLSAFTSFAQYAIGEWVSHNAYNGCDLVEEGNKAVYSVSKGSLFSYGKDDNALYTYNKVSGLSDNLISRIHYSVATKQLVIIYSNSNIDFLTDNDRVYNLSDLKESVIAGDKSVNSIYEADGYLYMSMPFGMMILDLKKREFKESLNWGINITGSAVIAGDIYISTLSDIRVGKKGTNLSDYSNWEIYSKDIFKTISSYKGKLYGIKDKDGVYYCESPGSWTASYKNNYLSFFKHTSSDELIAATNNTMQIAIFRDHGIYDILQTTEYATDYSINNNSNTIWITGKDNNLSKYDRSSKSFTNTNIIPKGNATPLPWYATVSDKNLYITGGGKKTNRYNTSGQVTIYDGYEWTNLDNKTIADFFGIKFSDIVHIAVNPNDPNHFFAFSWGEGLFEFRDNEPYKWHNFDNSPIESANAGSYNFMRCDGGAFDKYGNLWFTNSYVSKAIKVLKPDGTWLSFNHTGLTGHNNIGKICITSANQKWINILHTSKTNGIYIMGDTGADISEGSSFNEIFLSTLKYIDSGEEASVTPSSFGAITEDKNGDIWIGTNMGPIIASNPKNIFNNGYYFSRIKVARNDGTNLADYLLEGETITAIAIDGGNRKWIGTASNGVYLLSENGQETLHHFTTENSPLPSDEIQSLAIDNKTGLVYIGTMQGLMAYQSDAIEGKSDFSQVHVYPNPVRPDYNGTITITGLMDNSLVKITDINNNLIYQDNSIGGMMSWDGLNSKGNRVATGVYLVYATSEDGKKGVAAKILFVR